MMRVIQQGGWRLSLKGLALISAGLVGLSGCHDRDLHSFDQSHFPRTDSPKLCFELYSSSRPSAGLILDVPRSDRPVQHSIVLPFQMVSADPARAIYLTWGSFSRSALLSYVATSDVARQQAIGIRPRYDDAADADFEKEDLPGSLYLLSSGLKRRFFFRPILKGSESTEQVTLATIATDSIKAVIVRFPPRAEILESREGSLQELSHRKDGDSQLKMFSSPIAAQPDLRPIDVVFQVPPTQAQSLIAEYTLKLFGVILVPLIALITLKAPKVKAPKTRMVVLSITIPLEVVILIGSVWWAFYIQSVVGPQAIFEVALAVAGAALTVVAAVVE